VTDWLAAALRFALYLDLMLLAGLAARCVYAARQASLLPSRRVLSALGGLAVILSVTGFLYSVAGMAGVAVTDLDQDTLRFVLAETTPGWSFLVRLAALTAALVAIAFVTRRRTAIWVVAAASGTALATLAWVGHAAVSEGPAGTIHLLSDVAHLLAAALWVGALAVLLASLIQPPAQSRPLSDMHDALHAFSTVGSIVVALLLLTGTVNLWLTVGPSGLPLLPASPYGQLLILKLLLFLAMLGLAALNRVRLTPRLAAALAKGDTRTATGALRASIVAEAAAAVVIVALVAWLGMLAPPSAS
jgi:putative copper resistance protein D